MANSLLEGQGLFGGVNWAKAGEVGLALLISPLIGFVSAAILLLTLKRLVPDPELYSPPPADEKLVRRGGFARPGHDLWRSQHGARLERRTERNGADHARPDRPGAGSLRTQSQGGLGARDALAAAEQLKVRLMSYRGPSSPDVVRKLDSIITDLDGKVSLREVPAEERWKVRSRIFQLNQLLERRGSKGSASDYKDLDRPRRELRQAIEYVPTWVVVGVALCLGVGTTIGYRRIVVTVAEKIGKTHLTYAQGATAEVVAMATIGLADVAGLPVSTTQVLSSGVAGTMWANQSGIQAHDPQHRPGLGLDVARRDADVGPAFYLRQAGTGKLTACYTLALEIFVTWESCHAFSLSGDESLSGTSRCLEHVSHAGHGRDV